MKLPTFILSVWLYGKLFAGFEVLIRSREMIVGEIPYCNMKIQDIIQTVGHEGKQVPFPAKGNNLIISIMRSCLSMTKESRPTFKEIVGQLQQRNKGAASSKKSKFSYFWEELVISVDELFNFFGS